MTVLIETRKKTKGLRIGEVKKTATRILELLNCSEAELSILLVDDREIRVLNRDYRKMDKATDVIAFAMRDGEFAYMNKNMLGDVVISVETAKKQALEAGKEIWDEVRFLLIHGILHLLGYDHVNDDVKRKKMEKKERELLKRLEKPGNETQKLV